jgi:Flp pilus assembly protein protease CpaA
MIESLGLGVTDLLIGAALLTVSIIDMRSRRIPNVIVFPLAAVALVHHFIAGSIGMSLVGFGVATAMHFPLWLLNVEKAGDAKLFMCLGLWWGPPGVVEASAWFAVVYLPIALVMILVKGKAGNLPKVFRYQWATMRGKDGGEKPEVTLLATAPIIAIAAVIARVTDWLDVLG